MYYPLDKNNDIKTPFQELFSVNQEKEDLEKLPYFSEALEMLSKEMLNIEKNYSKLQKKSDRLSKELEETQLDTQNKASLLEEATLHLRKILKNVQQGIIFVTAAGIINSYSAASERILEIKAQDLLFQDYWKIFSDDFFGFSMREALETLNGPKISITKANISDKGEKTLEITTGFLRTGSASKRGILLFIKDITGIEKLQRELALSDRMKELGEMTATLAHEIKNPLGGIEGYATLLKRELKGRDDLNRMVNYIIESACSLNRLVNEMLDYARPLKIKLERIELAKIIEKICQSVTVDPAYPQDIKVNIESKDPSLTISADKDFIYTALFNLIVNSVQAMPYGGSLNITIDKEDSYVSIKISDTGVGIEKENLKHLFSPFFTTKLHGNGLGLCEVNKIIKSHGGLISVESEVNVGTTFTIKLPQKGL